MDRPWAREPTDADAPSWLAELDPTLGPPFLPMGVRALAPGRWLTTDDAPALAHTRQVLAAHRADALVVPPGAGDALDELVDAVGAATGAAGARAGAAGVPVDPEARLAAAAESVAEDLCLLVRGEGGWVLAAGCVCAPSHWRLRAKVGRPVAEVHAPVPHYGDELADRVDRFLDRLAPGRGAWRRNWLVHTDDRLYAPSPPPSPDPPVRAVGAGDRLWLRSEYQTLRRLPATGAVAFTIRTQQAPLSVVRARPALATRMADAVASWSDDLVAYRGGEQLRRPLLGWLRTVEG